MKDLWTKISDFYEGMRNWQKALIFLGLFIIFIGNSGSESSFCMFVGAICFLLSGWYFLRSLFCKKKLTKKEIERKKREEEARMETAKKIAIAIKEGNYPEISVDIPLLENEIVYGVYSVAIIKEKTVRSTTNYGGPTASIKIMKGVRYRAGSIKHETVSEKKEYKEDTGLLYVTTQRFLFIGDKETDSIKAKDIVQLKLEGNIIIIYKNKGKVSKYEFIGNYDTFLGVMQGLNKM